MSSWDGSETRSPSASPPPAGRKPKLSGGKPSSNWLAATTGVAAFAPQDESSQVGKENGKSRKETIQEYMRAYASGRHPREPQQGGGQGRWVGDVEMQDDGQQHFQQTQPRHQPQPQPRQPVELTADQNAYRLFLNDHGNRKLQRHDLATRDTIWAESIARAKTRLDAVNAEKATLEAKVGQMERAREQYKIVNAVAVSEEDDRREERRWEEWLDRKRGLKRAMEGEGTEIDEAGRAKAKAKAEEDEGGVDI